MRSSSLLVPLVLLGVFWLTISPIRLGTRVLLLVEGTTVALILLVALIILVKLAGGSGPSGQGLTLSPFTLASGTGTSAIFLGIVFGFLSFAGFEAAATLGEETRHPRRDIPRAILGTAIFGGVYFVFVTWVEVMGFGTDEKGLAAFQGSGSLFGDLGSQFVGEWLGDIITLGAAVSAFGCALACSVGASRLLFALARDGIAPAGLARVSPAKRTPVVAAAVVAVTVLVLEFVLFAVYRPTAAVGSEDYVPASLSVFIAVGCHRHPHPPGGLRAGDRRRQPGCSSSRAPGRSPPGSSSSRSSPSRCSGTRSTRTSCPSRRA